MSGTVVVDASLATKWVLPEPYRVEARNLLLDWERDGTARLVPSLFLSEVNSPLLRLRRQALITPADARRAFGDLLAAITVRPDEPTLASRAFAIADGLGMRAAYDSLYIALAEREGCELWTADERLYNAVRASYPFVHWVGER